MRAGSVVQPNAIAFTLPEKELAGLQRALAAGAVSVGVKLGGVADPIPGRIAFVDNTVDTATGTIRVKAEFANANARLWPGMFVTVALAPRMLEGAWVVPAQAVQTGPDNQFVYVVGNDYKVVARPVTLAYVEEGLAVVNGVVAGARILVEGAQNLRPGKRRHRSRAREGSTKGKRERERARKGSTIWIFGLDLSIIAVVGL